MPFGYTSRLKTAASRDEGIAPTKAYKDRYRDVISHVGANSLVPFRVFALGVLVPQSNRTMSFFRRSARRGYGSSAGQDIHPVHNVRACSKKTGLPVCLEGFKPASWLW
jgi:hypothetical protein